MLTGGDRFSVKHVYLADQFFLCQLFIHQAQSFRALQSSAVGGYSLVKSKHPHSFARCLLRILESLFIFAGMNVVVCESLYGAVAWSTMMLESFGCVAMQSPATDGV